jgi:hypothetical protein
MFSQLTWQDWVAIGSFTFSVVTIIAYVDQRRSTKRTALLSRWAELNLDKTLSEEQINTLTEQKAIMEEQVSLKIPALARLAVLREEAQLHERAVAEHFIAWQAARNHLESETVELGIDPQIQQAISDHILPRYIRLERRDRLRTRVTVLSVALAAFSAVMPFPISTVFGLLVTIPLIYAGARLYALNVEDSERAFKVLRPYCHAVYGISAVGFGLLGWFILVNAGSDPVTKSVALVLLVGAGGLALLYFFLRDWIDRRVKQLCSTAPPLRVG